MENPIKEKPKKEKQLNEITCEITLSRFDMTGAVPFGGELCDHEYHSYNKVAAVAPPGKHEEE